MSEITIKDLSTLNIPSLKRVDELEHMRVVRLQGPIDKSTLPEMITIRDKIAESIDLNEVNILFDFDKVTHVDIATAVQIITRIMELQRNNKSFGLINASDELLDLIEHIKIESCEPLRIYKSEHEAVIGLNK